MAALKNISDILDEAALLLPASAFFTLILHPRYIGKQDDINGTA